jgi:hypothetical protein
MSVGGPGLDRNNNEDKIALERTHLLIPQEHATHTRMKKRVKNCVFAFSV